MKRAEFAQRLAFILISLALTSIALGAPPEHSQGEPPPFNHIGCEFEGGRTTCWVNEERYLGTLNAKDGSTCVTESGLVGTLYERVKVYEILPTMEQIVYRGSSHVIESRLQASAQSISEDPYRYEVAGTYCRASA